MPHPDVQVEVVNAGEVLQDPLRMTFPQSLHGPLWTSSTDLSLPLGLQTPEYYNIVFEKNLRILSF